VLLTEGDFKFLLIFWDAIAFRDKVKFLGAELLLHPIKVNSKSVFKGEFSGHKKLVYLLVFLQFLVHALVSAQRIGRPQNRPSVLVVRSLKDVIGFKDVSHKFGVAAEHYLEGGIFEGICF